MKLFMNRIWWLSVKNINKIFLENINKLFSILNKQNRPVSHSNLNEWLLIDNEACVVYLDYDNDNR